MRYRAAVCWAVLATFLPLSSRAGSDLEGVGEKVPAVRLRQADDTPYPLTGLKGKKAVVVVFLSFDCPVSTSYTAGLNELATAYRNRGVAFVGVCPASDEADV